MKSQFLGRVEFGEALRVQAEWHREILTATETGCVLGFECEPVITLGVRATAIDLVSSRAELAADGYAVMNVDRGGQATLHHPGQLVIFPLFSVRELGVRTWVEGLAEVSRQTLREWKIDAHWDEAFPGLYTARGKIMACGVRIRQGISTHGVAINVNNNLAEFSRIRACGASAARMDRIGDEAQPRAVFASWVDKFASHFRPQLTR